MARFIIFMNKTISTRIGILTSLIILTWNLYMGLTHIPGNSPLALLQFLFVMLGIAGSCYALTRYYASIDFLDFLKHGLRTLATIMFLIIAGNALLFFIFDSHKNFSALTLMVMKTIFSYSLSGLLSAFFTSYLFNTFTKK